MKKLFLLLFAVAMATGCKTSYDVTLSNGTRISGVTKPVLDKSTDHYKFTMVDGREANIPAGRIRTIEPHGESSGPQFVSPTQKKK